MFLNINMRSKNMGGKKNWVENIYVEKKLAWKYLCTCGLYLNESFCIPSRMHGRDCRQPSAWGPTYFIQKYKIQKYEIQNKNWKKVKNKFKV